MAAIHKRIQGSNIEDLLAEAGLITRGSVDKALKGRHYYRAFRLYKLYYKALTRILIEHGRKLGIQCPSALKDFMDTIKDVEADRDDRYMAFESLVQSEDFNEYIESLRLSQDIPENHMEKYILSVIDMIEVLFMNLDSLRQKDWQEFKNSLRLMMPWITITDDRFPFSRLI